MTGGGLPRLRLAMTGGGVTDEGGRGKKGVKKGIEKG